ncbi:hypothetical protein DCE79_11440 [Lysinibacillus sp. 2017]|uniref:hypothetical protein n=1 Tax=unclassified Lysinibacillus TaxID=2636778 RepID=UPI000D5294BD|nr:MULTISPECIES: hypothetical protein [unclassified Lysinibacillus]AWE07964.1 hypothetical protein DCE79_11440 [Lysinibacillus sp. 2017]TGN29998.1 hypothetical protein E4L99_17705 [Lysinibacillus sp. S2017]
MPFYPPAGRRGPYPIQRQRFGPPPPNAFSRPNNGAFYNGNQFDPRQDQQMFNPYQQQPQPSRFGMVSDNLNTMMGHMGTITNGINMMRQVGGIMSLFRL